MTHLDTELKKLKDSLIEMWNLVITQCYKSQEALERFDKDLAHEVLSNEKRVDAFELKINMDCESILALFNPLANDLRFVLSVMRINTDLERIGDYARSIARVVKDLDKPISSDCIRETNVIGTFSIANNMLTDALMAFEKEELSLLRPIFKIDDEIDKTNKKANKRIAELISKHPDETESLLELLSVIRRIERIGDQTKAIAEEIVFYVEAKVIRHQKKKDKLI